MASEKNEKFEPCDGNTLKGMHEDLAERLAGITFILEAAARRLRTERHPMAQEVLAAAQYLRNVLPQVRRLGSHADGAPTIH